MSKGERPGTARLDFHQEIVGPRVLATWAAPLLVALITVVVFLPTLRNQFLDWDDPINFLNNPSYRGLGWSNLRWMLTTTHMGHWIPLTWVTFGVDYLLWGMNPFGYHLTNLLLHAAGAVVFYFVALRLLRAGMARQGEVALRVGAGAAALFFAIHPLRVESVAWITERRDVLSGFWFLLTILTYLESVALTGARQRWWQTCSVGCYAMAVASKSIVMTLPLVLIVLDVYPLGRLGGRWRQWVDERARRIWAEKVPYVLLALVAGSVSAYAVRSIVEPLGARTLTSRIGVAFDGLGFYVWKAVLPFSIAPLYQISPMVDPLSLPIVVSALAVAGLTVVLFLLRRRWPACLAAWSAYAILLAPVSGIVQSGSQTVAARYSYLPSLALALLVGAGACRLAREAREGPGRAWARVGVAALLIGVAGLGALTWKQAHVWHDPETFWSYAVALQPTASIPHNNLGAVLMRQGRFDEAQRHIETAVRLSPDYLDARRNLATILEALGRVDDASQARARLGGLLLKQGNTDEAIALFQELVTARPGDPKAYNNLGAALFFKGDLDAAIEHFRRALQVDPSFAEARRNLDKALAMRAVGHRERAGRL
ncbi:MAG TPA: tetratricopeptide repeat protein [Candidatus Methylomirabilis sp.]|nr:tetratricopeptide repeat protein [Candidatus Methylomirabilis sp.]